MKEVILYMLIAISDGGYNRGTVIRIADFATEDKCNTVAQRISDDSVSLKCVQAMVLIKENM